MQKTANSDKTNGSQQLSDVRQKRKNKKMQNEASYMGN